MAKGKFERTKPHCNIGTIGHIDHGKTTLTAAITKVLAESGGAAVVAFGPIDKAPGGGGRGGTNATGAGGYETRQRAHAPVGCPGPAAYIQKKIPAAARM